MNLTMLLDMAAAGFDDRIAFGTKDHGVTYTELSARAAVGAAQLRELGVERLGSRVAPRAGSVISIHSDGVTRTRPASPTSSRTSSSTITTDDGCASSSSWSWSWPSR